METFGRKVDIYDLFNYIILNSDTVLSSQSFIINKLFNSWNYLMKVKLLLCKQPRTERNFLPISKIAKSLDFFVFGFLIVRHDNKFASLNKVQILYEIFALQMIETSNKMLYNSLPINQNHDQRKFHLLLKNNSFWFSTTITLIYIYNPY